MVDSDSSKPLILLKVISAGLAKSGEEWPRGPDRSDAAVSMLPRLPILDRLMSRPRTNRDHQNLIVYGGQAVPDLDPRELLAPCLRRHLERA